MIGNNDIIKLLLEKKANINVQNNLGLTPLYIAAIRQDIDIINTLVTDKLLVELNPPISLEKPWFCPTSGKAKWFL